MKTIEERAKEWGEYIVETTPYDVVNGKVCVFVEDRNIADVAEESYIEGATDQKAIDDAECVNKVLMGKGSAINCYKQGFHDAVERAKTAFGKTCGWLSTYPSCESWYNELFENFIKNMEE